MSEILPDRTIKALRKNCTRFHFKRKAKGRYGLIPITNYVELRRKMLELCQYKWFTIKL